MNSRMGVRRYGLYVLCKISFRHCKTSGGSVVMERPRLVKWMYEFLRKLKKMREEGFAPVYET